MGVQSGIVWILMAVVLCGCVTRQVPHATDTKMPDVKALTSAPLRNRLRVQLEAPVPEVWALIGDFSRYPEYSSGVEHVETIADRNGVPTEYICHFRPQQEGAASARHREIIQWYEPNLGYASHGVEPDPFGLQNLLTVVTITPGHEGAVLTWDEYYHAKDLDMNRDAFDMALTDIARHLVARFGGRVVEQYRDKTGNSK